MSRLLYTILYSLLLPFILLRLLWRARLAPAYRQRWRERFGLFPAPAFDHSKPVIWLHAVSVGETLAAVPLIKKLQQDHPNWQWVITTTTPTGSDRVRAVFGDTVFHVYAPYDLPIFLRAFLQRTTPALLIVMETELWPNTIHSCRQRNIPVVIANARLSEKSARGYAKFPTLTRNMLHEIHCVAAQQHTDGERFVALGLPREKLFVTGSIKFDLTLDEAVQKKTTALRAQWSQHNTRPVWLAASTHLGEDSVILDTFTQLKKQFSDLLLVIVPRHPERFSTVTAQCESTGLSVQRHSQQLTPDMDTDIIIGDTMGELMAFYGAADIAFVGGSLVPVGGHNLIEPAAWACPIISGPHLFNFSEVETLLRDNNALTIAKNANDMAQHIQQWLTDAPLRTSTGERAKAVADSNRGALNKLCSLIDVTLVPPMSSPME
ncbi:MAG: lipid IV(A) 3-deoxy-D-manno-octulosonic acid transferase [Pseudomonadales bacterium]